MGRPDKLVATAAYQPEPAAAAAARRFVRDTLETWVTSGNGSDGRGLVDDAVLLTSELVTNAVVHAGTQVQVTCTLADEGVEVAVRDSQPTSLVPEPPDIEHVPAERTSGRGLLLPAALASAWGVTYGRTAKAVWFRIGLGSPPPGADDGLDAAPDGPGTFAAAIRQAAAAQSRLAAAAAAVDGGVAAGLTGEPGYAELLQGTAQAARMAAGADAACILLADEDGELRLCGAAGALPPARPGQPARAPSAVTVPFLVEGRVTGLLSVTAAAPDAFGSGAAAALLAELADRAGPALDRARRADLDRLRRERIGALVIARDLACAGLRQDKIMAIAGEAVVPRLADWCAVLLAGEGSFRTVYARHADESRSSAVAWLLDRACEGAGAAGRAPLRAGAGPRAVWRWPLATAATAAGAAGAATAAGAGAAAGPPGTDSLTGDTAWCFPFASPSGEPGMLALGSGSGRLPREVSALAADLAARVGLALAGAAQYPPRLADGAGRARPRAASRGH